MSDQRTDYYLGTYIILGIGSLVIIQFKPPVLLSIFDRKNAIYEYYQYEHVTICVTKGKNSVSINKTYYYVGDNNGLPWMLRGLERVTLDAWHSKLAFTFLCVYFRLFNFHFYFLCHHGHLGFLAQKVNIFLFKYDYQPSSKTPFVATILLF